MLRTSGTNKREKNCTCLVGGVSRRCASKSSTTFPPREWPMRASNGLPPSLVSMNLPTSAAEAATVLGCGRCFSARWQDSQFHTTAVQTTGSTLIPLMCPKSDSKRGKGENLPEFFEKLFASSLEKPLQFLADPSKPCTMIPVCSPSLLSESHTVDS